ncbi:MAG: ABC transporter ATP-binding protein, partial [Rhizobiales bacterium]|nr:ABC transporter ATP-binding protein [Hyphomicrobiales bacterium]
PARLPPTPGFLLLDEPLAALDAKLRAQVQLELKDIQKRTGKTFFFVTHDQDEALTMSDRIVVMNQGRVEQSGTPEDLYHHPQSRFVAAFIGETNLFSGRVGAIDGEYLALDWQGVTLQAARGDRRPAIGQTVTAALRPERVDLHISRPADGKVIEGRIAKRVFKGSHSVFDIDVGAGAMVRAVAKSDAIDGLHGDRLWIGWASASLTILRD